jgi:hypothetical protein
MKLKTGQVKDKLRSLTSAYLASQTINKPSRQNRLAVRKFCPHFKNTAATILRAPRLTLLDFDQ